VTTMSKEQIRELFDREAILFGQQNAVPDFRVEELFGKDAVAEVKRVAHASKEPGRYLNAWSAGGYMLTYFYLHGFQYAATIRNIEIVCAQQALKEVPA